MKITKSQLKQIIKEELEAILSEARLGWRPGDKPTFASWEAARKAVPRSASGREGGKPKYSSSWRQAITRASGEGDLDPLEGHIGGGTGPEYTKALKRSQEEQEDELLAKDELEPHPDPAIEAERKRKRHRAKMRAWLSLQKEKRRAARR